MWFCLFLLFFLIVVTINYTGQQMYLQSITSEKPSTLCKTVILSTSFSFGRLWAESSNCISCPDWNKTKAIVVKEHRQCLWDRKKVLCALGLFVRIARAITGGRLRGHLTFNNEPVSRQKSLGAQLTLLHCYPRILTDSRRDHLRSTTHWYLCCLNKGDWGLLQA